MHRSLPPTPPPPSPPALRSAAGADSAADPAAPQSLPVAYQPPTHGQLGLLAGYLLAGAVLALLGAALGGRGGAAGWHLGLFLCCHAGIVAASWLPPQVLSRRLDAWLDRWVADVGGGFYGLMALSLFVGLEVAALVEDVRGFELSLGRMAEAMLPWLLGFSLESLMNSLKAIIWPVFLLSALGTTGALVTAGLAWGLFALGARVFPQPAFLTARRPRKSSDPPAS